MSDRGRSPARSGTGSTQLPVRPAQSPHGSGSGSRAGSPAPSSTAPGWTPGPGYDPAKPSGQQDRGNTRMELPPDAYVTDGQRDMFALRGNKFNSEGNSIVVEVNQYRMKKFDFQKKIHQYDVSASCY